MTLLLCAAAGKLPMNGTVKATSMMMGGKMQPAPSPPCTDMHPGVCAPVLQVIFPTLVFQELH